MHQCPWFQVSTTQRNGCANEMLLAAKLHELGTAGRPSSRRPRFRANSPFTRLVDPKISHRVIEPARGARKMARHVEPRNGAAAA
jgi:hypothetical protein